MVLVPTVFVLRTKNVQLFHYSAKVTAGPVNIKNLRKITFCLLWPLGAIYRRGKIAMEECGLFWVQTTTRKTGNG